LELRGVLIVGFAIRCWLAFGSAIFVDYSSRRLSVDSVLAEAARHFDGAEYGVAAELGCVSFFDDAIEGRADCVAAALPEADGVGVAIEGGDAGEFVIADDAWDICPVEEGFVDGFAVGVVADGAFAGVAIGGWGCIAGAVGVRPESCVHWLSFGACGAV
jgi:hypothetical protein